MSPLSFLDMELSPVSLCLLQIYIMLFLNKVFFTILKCIRMHLFIYKNSWNQCTLSVHQLILGFWVTFSQIWMSHKSKRRRKLWTKGKLTNRDRVVNYTNCLEMVNEVFMLSVKTRAGKSSWDIEKKEKLTALCSPVLLLSLGITYFWKISPIY